MMKLVALKVARPPCLLHRGPSARRLLNAAVTVSLFTVAVGCDRIPSMGGDAPPSVAAGALKAAADEKIVRSFYEGRQWKAAWARRDADALLSALDDGARHGLDGARFKALITGAGTQAEKDAELTLAALTYADALSRGVADPDELFEVYAVPRPEKDLGEGLSRALTTHDVEAWLASIAPQDSEYRTLSEAYLGYKALASAPITVGPPLTPGGVDARTAALGAWLRLVGFMPPSTQDAAYDGQMAQALRAMQKAADLPQTGQPDAATVRVMNESAALRAKQLAVNLERRRWLPREVPRTRIDVNTAAAQMTYLRDDKSVWQGRVVVGDPDPDHQTPQLFGAFDTLVVNPPWVVPAGIAQSEILPKGAAYLASERMTVEDGKVVQAPGPNSALGLVKFDMQNPHAIYLHDTPAKGVFAADDRHRSHGCARVDRAVEFARLLATERGKAVAFDQALAAGETQGVNIGEKIPVRLIYASVYVDAAGKVTFTDDPYGWDDIVSGALGLGPLATARPARAPVAHLLGP